MPTVLIAGANRGIGLEFARQYAGDGWRVIATSRDLAKAGALRDLGSKVAVHRLDVADFKAVTALGRELAAETIDLMIANAGVSLARAMLPQAVDEAAWTEMLGVNAMAPLVLAGAFLEQVKRSQGRRLVAMSSHLGSIGGNNSGGLYTYRSSKAALNAVWRSLACDHRDLIAVVLHPGWVRTDMGGPQAPLDVRDSVAGMRRLIARLTPEQSGQFLSYDGAAVPW